MKKLYLAGPMSGYPEHNYPAFDKAAEELRAKGFEVISPCDLNRAIGLQMERDIRTDGTSTPEQYATYMKADILAILEADGVAVLDRWYESKGARLEVAIAQILNKPVIWAGNLEPVVIPVRTYY